MKIRYYLSLGGAMLLAHAAFGQCVEPTDEPTAEEVVVQPVDYIDPSCTGSSYRPDDDNDLSVLLADLSAAVPDEIECVPVIEPDDGSTPTTEL
jgi:hypothetical protein